MINDESLICTRDLRLKEEYAAKQDHQAHRKYATWTHMPSGRRVTFVDETGIPVSTPSTYHFEEMTPAAYMGLYAYVMTWSVQSAQRREHVPPLNERAHLSVLVLDVDEDNVPIHEMVAYGRLIQNALELHFGIMSAFLLAGRMTASGAKKYHLFFPDVVVADTKLWMALDRLVTPFADTTGSRKKIDRAPTFARALRMHASERNVGDFSGIYQVLYAYDRDNQPLPPDVCFVMTSVRPAPGVLAAWMANPFVHARTEVAAALIKPTTDGASIHRSAMVIDDERESIRATLMTDRARGSWALAEVKRRCRRCQDQTHCRVLFRFVELSEKVGVFRWCLCPGCSEIVSLPYREVALTDVAEQVHAWPNLAPTDGVQLDVGRLDHIYTLPLELACQNGFKLSTADAFRLTNTRAIDVSRLGVLFGRQGGWPTWHLCLSARDCTDESSLLPRLSTGLARHGGLPEPAAGQNQIVTIKAPCGGGKTEVVMRMIADAPKTLVVAVRKSLTLELANRIHALAPGKRVAYYKNVPRESIGDVAVNDVLVVTPESLPRFVMRGPGGAYSFGATLLVVDELCSVVKTLYDSATTAHSRMDIQSALLAAMASARRVVCMDKDIGFGERLFLAAALYHIDEAPRPVQLGNFNGPPVTTLAHIDMQDEIKRRVVFWPDMPTMSAAIVDKLEAGGSVAIFCAAKSDAFTLAEYVRTALPDMRVMLLTGSSTETDKSDFSAAPNDVLTAASVRCFIYTSTVSVGISIDRHPFTDVFVVLGSHLTWRDALQGEARVRTLQGQAAGLREFNVYINNVALKDDAVNVMPTVGTAMITAQAKVRSAGVVRYGVANCEAVQLDGSRDLPETPLAIAETVTRAIHAHEVHLQSHYLFEWLGDQEAVYMESAKQRDVVESLREARKSGSQLRMTQDVLDDDDDHATAAQKRRKVTTVVGPSALEEVTALAKSPAFVEWIKTHRPCLGVWHGVYLAQRRLLAGADEPGPAVSGVEGLAKSLSGPSLLCMAAARVCSACDVFEGRVVPMGTYDELATFLSPLDGAETWTADRLFGWLSSSAVGSIDCAATNNVKAQLRAFNKPFKVVDPLKEKEERAKYAYRLMRALLGGKEAMAAPKKIIWTARKFSRDESLFASVQIEDESPW